MLEPFRGQICNWFEADVEGTTIHSVLNRNHGYTVSYSAVRHFLKHLGTERRIPAATILDCPSADAAQDDFGVGTTLIQQTWHALKTWFLS